MKLLRGSGCPAPGSCRILDPLMSSTMLMMSQQVKFCQSYRQYYAHRHAADKQDFGTFEKYKAETERESKIAGMQHDGTVHIKIQGVRNLWRRIKDESVDEACAFAFFTSVGSRKFVR